MLKNILTYSFIIFNIVACANNPIRSYKHDSDKMLEAINNNNIESQTYGNPSNPDILFYMEYGTTLRMISNYNGSDNQLKVAQNIVDIWTNSWNNTTGGQITNEAKQMLINDSATDYEPKGYEKTMLATYRALNHIDNNNWDNARIEIKKMYQTEQAIANYNQAMYIQEKANADKINSNANEKRLYSQILQKYDFSDINAPQVLALKNAYQNAFSHYLAGFIFEALNEPSLSRPGYLKSGQLAPFNKLSQKSIDNLDHGIISPSGYSNVLIIQEIGHAPQLKSHEIHIPFAVSKGGVNCITNINLFFPTLINDPSAINSYSYFIDDKSQNQELYANYDLMAARSLHDQMPHLIARNISAAIRNIGISAVSCAEGGTTGAIFDIANIITGVLLDRADERSWVLLPSKIYLNRVQLPFGNHKFSIVVNGITYTKTVNLKSRYQIIDMRIIGNKFFLNTQKLK